MADIVQRTLDGELLLALPRPDPEKKRKRKSWHKHGNARRATLKQEAFSRIAEAWDVPKPVCHICGCPHVEALTIGHPDGNGAEHRKYIFEARIKGRRTTLRKAKAPYKTNIGGHHLTRWIMKATLEEIREWNVHLECTYCNFYEAFNGNYPEPDKRPQWEMIERV